MEGNLGRPPTSDREISGGTTGMVGEEPLGSAGGGEETASMMGECKSTEWTDEKHRLYLNSIEASFVNQLYNRGYHSNDMIGWLSRTKKDPNSSSSKVNNLYSGQFKVLRKGFWEKLKFERARTRTDIENDSRIISANPWIQHFRSPSTGRGLVLTSSDQQENNEFSSKATHLRSLRDGMADCGEVTSSKKLSPCCTLLYCQDSVGSSTEMSDQNFVDKDYERESQLSRTRRKKRSRAAVADASGIDQVVPFGKSPVVTCSDESCASLKRKDGECSGMNTDNSNVFVHLESKPSQLKDQELNSADFNAD